MEKNKIIYQNIGQRSKTTHSQSKISDQSYSKKTFSIDKITNLICNLLQLNLKLFQDLFRYKHAFNSFQADLNTHLTTIANQQHQESHVNDDDINDDTNNVVNENNQNKKTIELQQTKQKISDMICEKFLQTCSDLGQPGLGDDNYESSIYSILGMIL